MNKKLPVNSSKIISGHLLSKIELFFFCSITFFLGGIDLQGQNNNPGNPLQGFDKNKVLKEFRKKEGSELKQPKAYAGFLYFKEQEFIGKKNGTWQKSLAPIPPTNLSGTCGNIDFETGDLSGWNGFTGSNPGCCPTSGFVSNGVNAAANDPNARQTIMTGAGVDPCGGFPVIAPAMPGYAAGIYSCRLGNGVNGGQAERLETVFTPTASNNIFTYQYAVVLENPGHSASDQPFFKVAILDAGGNPIPCTSVLYVAGGGIPGFQNSPNCAGVIFKPWATVSVDLVGQIGNPVTVRFTSADCTLGGHYGYGYVNCECSPLIVTQQDSLCVGSSTTLTAPYEDNNTYNWTGPGGPYTGQIITITQGGTYAVTMLSSTGCVKMINYVVTENPTAFVSPIPDQTVCSGSSVALTASISGAATMGTWSGGTGTFSPNNTSLSCTYIPSGSEITAGSVTLTFTTDDPAGPCPAASTQTTITINPKAIVSAGPDQTICIGNTATLAATISGSATSGTWTGGTGTYNPDNTSVSAVYTPSTAETSASMATLTYTTNDPAGPCPNVSDAMTITINQLPTANAGSAQYVCSGSAIALAGSIGGSASSGTWSGGNGTFSPDNTTLNAQYTASAAEFAAGSVMLTLTTDDPVGPCTFSSSNVTFYFYQNPVVDFTADIRSGCPIHCVNFADISTVAGGDSVAAWNWDFGDGSSGSTSSSPFHCFSTPGFYDIKLTATSNHGCTSFLNKPQMIHVFNVPVAEFLPTPNPATVIDPTITFNNQSSSDVNYWFWNFGDGNTLAPNTSSPVHVYPNEASASYMVTLIVHNANDCYDTIPHEIFIGPEFTFFIPNVFTPNGDGINDYFFGSGIGIINYDLWIFDRWGDMIFHGRDLNDKWNGKANDGANTAQIDVYVWKVKLTDVFNKVHNYIGTVSIVK